MNLTKLDQRRLASLKKKCKWEDMSDDDALRALLVMFDTLLSLIEERGSVTIK